MLPWRGSANRQTGTRLGFVELGVIIDPTRIHQPGRKEGQCSRQHQLGVDAHELRDPSGRLPGLVQVVHHWIQHLEPPFHSPKLGVLRHVLTTIKQEQIQLLRHAVETAMAGRLHTP